MSLAEVAGSLVEGLHAQLPESGFRLDGFEVHLGALVDLEPEALRAMLSAHLPGVEVKITVIDALYRCKDCGAEYPADEHPCPVCGSPNAEVVHGAELQIVRAWGQRM